MCDVQTLFSNYSMDVHYIVCFRTVCVCGAGGPHARCDMLIYILENTRPCLWSQPLCLYSRSRPPSSANPQPLAVRFLTPPTHARDAGAVIAAH